MTDEMKSNFNHEVKVTEKEFYEWLNERKESVKKSEGKSGKEIWEELLEGATDTKNKLEK